MTLGYALNDLPGEPEFAHFPSFWPPRPLPKQYYLDQMGINIQPLEEGNSTSYDVVNHASDRLGRTPLVEADLQQMHINTQRQQHVCHTIITNYNHLGSLSYASGMGGKSVLVYVFYCYICFFNSFSIFYKNSKISIQIIWS